MQRSHSFIERYNSLLHLFARADGDAHTAVAAGVVGAVAHQHTGCVHPAHKLGVRRTDFNEDEVGATGPAAYAGRIERLFELRTRGQYLTDVPIQIGSIRSEEHTS